MSESHESWSDDRDLHGLELVIGGQPHLRCGCGFQFRFHGKTTMIAMKVMRLIEDAHQSAPHEPIKGFDD